ncbi:hypothetical protein HMPREF9151_00935 [Hoylesella saccharolytica F0055]|uniref:Uncharacterized protein n=1 Tax=Hoylesella saccharolytica F0055 TaxID=1127699 RepID=L1NF89_9BACT|nr:hypothetical protein HMPREF9151_00935 [Hoylesella saccharolytica F0055]
MRIDPHKNCLLLFNLYFFFLLLLRCKTPFQALSIVINFPYSCI